MHIQFKPVQRFCNGHSLVPLIGSPFCIHFRIDLPRRPLHRHNPFQQINISDMELDAGNFVETPELRDNRRRFHFRTLRRTEITHA